jgi:glycosyltransferase involved in cell wall biosynthesis
MQLISNQLPQPNPLSRHLPENMVCFSHLRWDFVFQRPQHLLTRMASVMNVFYIEEPLIAEIECPTYRYESRGEGIAVITPLLPAGLNHAESLFIQKKLFAEFMLDFAAGNVAFWYYTPMALEFTREYRPELIVFDCMDELSAFKFAPDSIKVLEKELLQKADIVFTGGHSLYEAKKNQHYNIHAFPSSIDKAHFAKARGLKDQPEDQIKNNRIKLGFYGVIDERFDIELIRGIARLRPEWKLILIGPVVKIDPATLPTGENIYYLGPKTYDELPEYMAAWDIALIPFLLNESTRFISPTKTPEYLAAGLPVISTPIRDVINPYGKFGLVSIGKDAADFVCFADKVLYQGDYKEWLQRVDFFLAHNSWDITCDRMIELLIKTIKSSMVVYNEIAKS